jgi:hypothetical protein
MINNVFHYNYSKYARHNLAVFLELITCDMITLKIIINAKTLKFKLIA